jgi:hypothetical protein
MNNYYYIIMNNFYNFCNKIHMAIEDLLCISEQKEFIVELDIKDIYYLFTIFISSDKFKKELTSQNSILQKGIYSLNIIYLHTNEELFDFSILYLEKIEKEIKENKMTEQKYIVLANYLKKIIDLKNNMIKYNFVYNEEELVIYKKNNKYTYEFYF